MKQGKFIALEGTEGVGKSTQVRLLCEYLERENIPYVLTREPGGCEISEKIREIILNGEHKTMTDQTEALLYAASRTQHLEEVILPSIASGKLVVCDRYVFSSIAYQGYGRGILDFVEKANSHAIQTRLPDLNIFLDLSPKDAFARKGGADKSDRLETSGDEFFERVYAGFKILAAREDFVTIDTRGSVEETFALIVGAMKDNGII